MKRNRIYHCSNLLFCSHCIKFDWPCLWSFSFVVSFLPSWTLDTCHIHTTYSTTYNILNEISYLFWFLLTLYFQVPTISFDTNYYKCLPVCIVVIFTVILSVIDSCFCLIATWWSTSVRIFLLKGSVTVYSHVD